MCQINTDPMTFQVPRPHTMVPPAQLAAMWVMVPPDIDMAASSGDITAREHSDTAQLVCAAQGVPQPKIVWRREGGQKIRVAAAGARGGQHQQRMVAVVS